MKTALASREDALRSAIEERVREQGGRLVGWALGASIARRVLGLVNAELDKMSPDGSELRLAFDEWVRREINRMETEPERAAEIGIAIRRVVAHETVPGLDVGYLGAHSHRVRGRYCQAERPSGRLRRGRPGQSRRYPGSRSARSARLQTAAEGIIRSLLPSAQLRIAEFIAQVVGQLGYRNGGGPAGTSDRHVIYSIFV